MIAGSCVSAKGRRKDPGAPGGGVGDVAVAGVRQELLVLDPCSRILRPLQAGPGGAGGVSGRDPLLGAVSVGAATKLTARCVAWAWASTASCCYAWRRRRGIAI